MSNVRGVKKVEANLTKTTGKLCTLTGNLNKKLRSDIFRISTQGVN